MFCCCRSRSRSAIFGTALVTRPRVDAGVAALTALSLAMAALAAAVAAVAAAVAAAAIALDALRASFNSSMAWSFAKMDAAVGWFAFSDSLSCFCNVRI